MNTLVPRCSYLVLGEVLAINPGAEAMLELSDRQAHGLTLERLFPPPNRCAELSEAALELLQPLRERQVEVPLVDGRVVNVDCTVTPMTELSGPGRFMIELVDLGEHLRVKREELLIAQNESTRTVLRGLAHEIRNPLGGLRGAAQLLERAFDDPAVSEYSSVIIAEADRLQNLLDRMLGPRQPTAAGGSKYSRGHRACMHLDSRRGRSGSLRCTGL